MKNIIKTILIMFISTFFSVPILAAPYVSLTLNYDGQNHSYNAEAVYLHINGTELKNLPMQPVIFNDYTLVPARETFEALGAEVLWYKDTYEIEVLYGDITVKMKLDQKVAVVNGESYEMQIPPKLINSKTMIPLRFVSEAVGLNVEWDGVARIVNISDSGTVDSRGNITSLAMPSSNENTFTIYADKKIEKYEVIKLSENIYALDIYNFKSMISDSSINSVSHFVSKVTIEEHDNVTRFIFYLTEETFNDVFFDDSGKTLSINWGGSYITKIEKYNDGANDILMIYSENNLKYTIDTTSSEKIILDLKKVNSEKITQIIKETEYIQDIKYYQAGEDFKIEIYVKGEVGVNEKYVSEGLVLTIGENIILENTLPDKDADVIISKKSISLDINSIIHTDNYLSKQYILNFNQDISSSLALGEHEVSNSLVKSLVAENISGKTQITINSTQIIAVNITEDNSYIYIDIVTPQEKYKNIVVIDPGHGGTDPGTSGLGVVEKEVVLDIGNRIIALAENDPDIKVYSTRTTDFYPEFNDRTNLGNEVGDMFVSIHINAPGSNNSSASGTEVYYLNYNTSERGINSKVMADVFQKNIVAAIDTRDRGVKTADFKVLRDSNIPAILCELAFVTNPEDNAKLASDEYRQIIAKTLFDSMKQIFAQYPSTR